MRRSYTRMVLVLTLAAAGVAACSGDGGPGRHASTRSWPAGSPATLDEVGFVQPDGQKVAAADVTTQIKALSGELARAAELRRDGRRRGDRERRDRRRSTVDWPLPGGARWSYQSTVRLNEGGDDGWR